MVQPAAGGHLQQARLVGLEGDAGRGGDVDLAPDTMAAWVRASATAGFDRLRRRAAVAAEAERDAYREAGDGPGVPQPPVGSVRARLGPRRRRWRRLHACSTSGDRSRVAPGVPPGGRHVQWRSTARRQALGLDFFQAVEAVQVRRQRAAGGRWRGPATNRGGRLPAPARHRFVIHHRRARAHDLVVAGPRSSRARARAGPPPASRARPRRWSALQWRRSPSASAAIALAPPRWPDSTGIAQRRPRR